MKEGKPHEGNKRKAKWVLAKKKSLIGRKLKLCIVFRININHLFSFKVNFPQGGFNCKGLFMTFLKFLILTKPN